MNVRSARPSDLPAIVDIYNHAVLHSTATADHEPQSLEARAAWLASREADGLPVLVADEAASGPARVVGWGSLNPYKSRFGYRYTVENSVYVAPDARGRGVGKELLTVLIAEARRLRLHAILAGVDGENEASLRLHRRAGFVEVGRLRQVVHKFDRWLDVALLELLLPPDDVP